MNGKGLALAGALFMAGCNGDAGGFLDSSTQPSAQEIENVQKQLKLEAGNLYFLDPARALTSVSADYQKCLETQATIRFKFIAVLTGRLDLMDESDVAFGERLDYPTLWSTLDQAHRSMGAFIPSANADQIREATALVKTPIIYSSLGLNVLAIPIIQGKRNKA